MARTRRRPLLTGILTFLFIYLLEGASVAAMFTGLPVGPLVDLLLAFAFHLGAACVVSYGFWGPWDFRYADDKNWAAMGFVIVLAIPVYGLLGFTGAFAAVHWRRRFNAAGGDVIEQFEKYIAYEPEIESRMRDMPLLPVLAIKEGETELQRMAKVAPLLDIIKTGDIDMKRGAIFSLSRLDTKVAVRILRQALQGIDPASQFYVAGQLSRIEKVLSERIIRTRRRLELEPDNVELKVRLARHNKEYVESGLLEPSVERYFVRQAIEMCEQALAEDPKRVDVLLDLAELRKRQGEVTEAIEAYRGVLAVDDSSVAARSGLAHCYFEQRDIPNLSQILAELKVAGETPAELADVMSFWEGANA